MLAAFFMITIIVWSTLDTSIAGKREPLAPWPERRRRLKDLLPPLFVFALVMGSIYTGWATPTEAAGVGAVAAMILVTCYGKMSWKLIKDSMLTTVGTTAMTLLILVAAFYLNFVLGVLGVPAQVSAFVAGFDAPPWLMMLLLVVLYLILGCFLDSLAMMIATIPIVWPVVQHLGFDSIWFGIFLVLMCELALITPPVG